MFVTYLLGFIIASFVLSFIDTKFIGFVEEDPWTGAMIVGVTAILWPFALVAAVIGGIFYIPFYFGRKWAKR